MKLLPDDRLHQRLRPHRDELDDRGARPRRPPRGARRATTRRCAGGSRRSAGRCRASRSRSATRRARRSGRASAARSTCAASRSRASTSAAARRVDRDGWFPTRDGGFVDDDGYLFLEGRIDDVIVRGGENLSPGEIEDVLLDAPGRRRLRGGRRPRRAVGRGGRRGRRAATRRRRRRADELQEWVQERLRSSRAPQRIEFRDELPYNETGKLLRRRVKAELTGEAS